ncbi:response regulator receiver domain protein [Synechococcus sp. PCC 7335]|uniref:response regulator n=1 Tax=Synechococcus sp. (strain ATCC 29403 / PCC 7335) TaxID=91464 RepID=UPI00017EE3E4|nr:response regulator [Synechococcus sp. PCC 7335]EDX85642.1 response regulator receiver domain protein [Synechococcus sp. PCC 7335]
MSTLSPLSLDRRQHSKKPRMLVVDDEPDNLDLLFRTFRRNFKVLKAKSGVEALEILESNGEVAVIISDQRMPEMKGTEFLSKTVPEFPDTFRIILTGFTDVEDLVEAINDGQVYRYITKPWDPDELKLVVSRASSTYELLKGQTTELHKAEKQSKMVMTVGQIAAQSMRKEEALQYLAHGFGEILSADACTLLLTDESKAGSYGQVDVEKVSNSQLVVDVFASQQSQTLIDIQSDETLANRPLYTDGTQCHLALPIIYQGNALGAFSFQWKTSYETIDDVIQLLGLISPQIALSLKAAVL